MTRYSFISVHNSTEHGLTTYPVRIRWRDSCCSSTERHAGAGVGAEVAVHNEDFATTRPRDAIVPCSLDPDPFWLWLWLHAIHISTRRTTRSGSPRSYHVVMRRVRLFEKGVLGGLFGNCLCDPYAFIWKASPVSALAKINVYMPGPTACEYLGLAL
eukprot:COSAG06_NODE_3712_length_4986_cov_54.729691_3_plen_157_part_00